MTRPCYFSFFFSSRRRHTRCSRDWSSDVCSSDLQARHDAVFLERRKSSRNLASQKGDPMTHENNLMTVRQFDGNAYKSSQTARSEEHTSELQSRLHLVCRLLLEKKKTHAQPASHDTDSHGN